MKLSRGVQFFLTFVIVTIFITACNAGKETQSTENLPPAAQQSSPTDAIAAKAPSSDSTEACTLLPKEDVSQVLGAPVLSAEASGLGGVCTYKTENLGVDFTIAAHSGSTKSMNTTLTRLGDLALVVPGLGDLAFYNTASANGLLLLKNDASYLFNISDLNYQPLDPSFVQATEKALAEKLLSILP
jgi:hypothetical protein